MVPATEATSDEIDQKPNSRLCERDSNSRRLQTNEEVPKEVLQKWDCESLEQFDAKDEFQLKDFQVKDNENIFTESAQTGIILLSEKENNSDKNKDQLKPSVDHFAETLKDEQTEIQVPKNENNEMESLERKHEKKVEEFQMETLPRFTLQVTDLDFDKKFDQNFFNENLPEVDSCSDIDENSRAQILAAKRTLMTNAILSSIFLVVFGLMMICSTSNRRYYSVVVLTMLKGALPIFTTIANFGTVQYVIKQYWHYLKSSQIFISLMNLFSKFWKKIELLNIKIVLKILYTIEINNSQIKTLENFRK